MKKKKIKTREEIKQRKIVSKCNKWNELREKKVRQEKTNTNTQQKQQTAMRTCTAFFMVIMMVGRLLARRAASDLDRGRIDSKKLGDASFLRSLEGRGDSLVTEDEGSVDAWRASSPERRRWRDCTGEGRRGLGGVERLWGYCDGVEKKVGVLERRAMVEGHATRSSRPHHVHSSVIRHSL